MKLLKEDSYYPQAYLRKIPPLLPALRTTVLIRAAAYTRLHRQEGGEKKKPRVHSRYHRQELKLRVKRWCDGRGGHMHRVNRTPCQGKEEMAGGAWQPVNNTWLALGDGEVLRPRLRVSAWQVTHHVCVHRFFGIPQTPERILPREIPSQTFLRAGSLRACWVSFSA